MYNWEGEFPFSEVLRESFVIGILYENQKPVHSQPQYKLNSRTCVL